MLKIENTEVLGWEHAIRGMRNPMNSLEKSDSGSCPNGTEYGYCYADHRKYCPRRTTDAPAFCIGPNDLNLMNRLRNAGTDHRKFMRMITVYVDLIGPLYWWKEFDTYKVGTVANSCSTMHKIHEKEFTLEDFSCEHLSEYREHKMYSPNEYRFSSLDLLNLEIDVLNQCREKFMETRDRPILNKKYWWQMIQLLPSSYNQRRTVMLNYEVLANIYKSRKDHKLDEWHTFCDWIEGLPYSELITGPSLKDIPISNEIMEEAKRRVHEELDAQLDHFCKSHEGFSIKIPKEKVSPEVLNLIDRVEREEQQRVKFSNHIPLAYYCRRCDAKKNGEATDAYCQKCPYKVKIVEISVMSDGSLEPRFVIDMEDDRNGQQ